MKLGKGIIKCINCKFEVGENYSSNGICFDCMIFPKCGNS